MVLPGSNEEIISRGKEDGQRELEKALKQQRKDETDF